MKNDALFKMMVDDLTGTVKQPKKMTIDLMAPKPPKPPKPKNPDPFDLVPLVPLEKDEESSEEWKPIRRPDTDDSLEKWYWKEKAVLEKEYAEIRRRAEELKKSDDDDDLLRWIFQGFELNGKATVLNEIRDYLFW